MAVNAGIFEGRKTGLGWKFARKLILGRAKAESGFNRCIAAHLVDKKYPKPPPRQGGMRDPRIKLAFMDAAKACGAKFTSAGEKKFAEIEKQARELELGRS